jgi:hypothetical protein
MAKLAAVTAANTFFAGEDKTLVFEVTNAAGLPEDVDGWAMEWVLRKPKPGVDISLDQGPEVLRKDTATAGVVVVGVFNAAKAQNTQRIEVRLVDTDTAELKAGDYVHSLKRTDEGEETVLAYGPFKLLKAASR